MRRTLLAVAAASLAVALPAVTIGASSTRFNATLGGRDAKSGSDAKGKASYVLSRTGRSLRFELEAEDLEGKAAAAHVHLGRRGSEGPVILTLRQSSFRLPLRGTMTRAKFTPAGDVKSFAGAVKAMKAGRTYTNLHTSKFPAGEIRGQNRVRR